MGRRYRVFCDVERASSTQVRTVIIAGNPSVVTARRTTWRISSAVTPDCRASLTCACVAPSIWRPIAMPSLTRARDFSSNGPAPWAAAPRRSYASHTAGYARLNASYAAGNVVIAFLLRAPVQLRAPNRSCHDLGDFTAEAWDSLYSC